MEYVVAGIVVVGIVGFIIYKNVKRKPRSGSGGGKPGKTDNKNKL